MVLAKWNIQVARDLIWLVLGVAVGVNDLIIQQGAQYPRPAALAFSATLLGIPAFLHSDKKKPGDSE